MENRPRPPDCRAIVACEVRELAPPVTQEKIIEALERMSAAERRRFADTFTRIIEEMGEGRESPPMMFEEVRGGRHTAKK